MLPGLIIHGHLLGLGANLLEVDLRESSSAQDAAKTVAEYALQMDNKLDYRARLEPGIVV